MASRNNGMRHKQQTQAARYCLQCDDGTQLVFGKLAVQGAVRGVAYSVPGVVGWHCLVCAEVEYDTSAESRDSAERVNIALEAAAARHPTQGA